jgi:small basic protein (TIGR04137 family)
MTQHPSLKAGKKGTKFRSVLKRFEKIQELAEKEKWNEAKDSAYRLPKVKRVRFKAKKAVKAAEGEAGKEEAKPGAKPAAPAAGAKAAAPAAGAKPAAKGGK